ncbi:glycosyltransferase family 4 protein [Blastopirellula marina]|nr:glycosyltransferase family 4 protein [Blastopirellula marina]
MMNGMHASRGTIEELGDHPPKGNVDSRTVLVTSRLALADVERATFFSIDASHKYVLVTISPVVLGKIRGFFRVLSLAVRVLAAIRRTKPDLIVFEDQRTGGSCCLFLRILGVKTPVLIWNFNMFKPYRNLKWLLTQKGGKAAASLVVYSRHEQKVYSKVFGVPTSKFRFKPYSGPYLDDARYVSLLEDRTKRDCVVAPGSWGRDYKLLADVAARLPSIRFVVLAFSNSVAGVDFPENVEVVNGIQELEYCRYIAEARVCYVPVANQTTANGHIAIVQAMCLKPPLITNPTPGTIDYLDQRTMIACSDSDPVTVASQIADVYENGDKYDTMVNPAHEFARANFGVDWDIEMIDEVLSSTTEPTAPN